MACSRQPSLRKIGSRRPGGVEMIAMRRAAPAAPASKSRRTCRRMISSSVSGAKFEAMGTGVVVVDRLPVGGHNRPEVRGVAHPAFDLERADACLNQIGDVPDHAQILECQQMAFTNGAQRPAVVHAHQFVRPSAGLHATRRGWKLLPNRTPDMPHCPDLGDAHVAVNRSTRPSMPRQTGRSRQWHGH